MKPSKRIAAIIGVVCGAELIAAIVIGGAGIGALFGWNGAAVGIIAVSLLVGLAHRRRKSRIVDEQTRGSSDQSSVMRIRSR